MAVQALPALMTAGAGAAGAGTGTAAAGAGASGGIFGGGMMANLMKPLQKLGGGNLGGLSGIFGGGSKKDEPLSEEKAAMMLSKGGF